MEQHGVQQRVPGQAGRRAVQVAAGLLLLGAGSARADNCEAIKTGIETRMRAGGLGNVVLVVSEPGAARPAGRVLGSCSQGTRLIVLGSVPVPVTGASAPPAAVAAGNPVVGGAAAAPAVARSAAPAPAPAPAPAADAIPTECKDGSIVIGPDCNDPRAVRLTRTEIDKLQAEQAERADKDRAERAAKPASSS